MDDELRGFLEEAGFYQKDIDKEHRFANQISCCVRAGFDVAIAPSSGVVGFDVDMLRGMWPEGLPSWVTDFFEPVLSPDTPGTTLIWL